MKLAWWILIVWPALITFVAVLGCRPASPGGSAEGDLTRAERLAREVLVVDTHIDAPYRLTEDWADVGLRTDGDFDYPRARQGGLDVAFMSIYVPATYQERGGARELADGLIDMVEGLTRAHPDKFAMVTRADEARQMLGSNRLGLALGMENGAPIEGSLDSLRHFHERGVRYITLTHSKNNHICDSSYDEQRKWNGLSPFGREVVEEMNRLGIMIDISHVSDDTFEQVVELSRAPLIASHSSCRHFTPAFERNMSDPMIQRLAAGGGVIQINFGSAFLREDSWKQSTDYWKARRKFLEERGLEPDHEEGAAFGDRYWSERDRIYAELADVVAHIDRVVRLVGVDHVGLGSDFDGVGDSLPVGLKDVSQYPNLVQALLDEGYTDEDVAKICGGNLLRVWEAVERVAANEASADS